MDTLGPQLQEILHLAEAKLIEQGRPVYLVELSPGNTVAWDNCCGENDIGGQLWVRVISLTPRPQPSQPCDIQAMHVRLGLGVLRCAHTLDNEGTPPTAEEMESDVLAMTADADATLSALRAWDPDTVRPGVVAMKTFAIEAGLPLGPQGGCAGFEWTFTFQYLPCWD